MSGETITTVVGNLAADPELRYTQTGAPVANFTVASASRVFDKASGEWRDGDPLFLRCTLWNQPAEYLVESLAKGSRVVVQGRLKQRSFETTEGDRRTVIELAAEEVGVSIRYSVAKISKPSTTGAAAPKSEAADAEPPF